MATNLISNILTRFYSNASNARRAARQAGITTFEVASTNQGCKVVVAPVVNTTGDQLGGFPVADLSVANAVADIVRARQAAVTKLAHKEFAVYGPSKVVKPIEFVRTFLAANPNLARKDAVAALVAAGVSYATARTQYQVWFSKQK